MWFPLSLTISVWSGWGWCSAKPHSKELCSKCCCWCSCRWWSEMVDDDKEEDEEGDPPVSWTGRKINACLLTIRVGTMATPWLLNEVCGECPLLITERDEWAPKVARWCAERCLWVVLLIPLQLCVRGTVCSGLLSSRLLLDILETGQTCQSSIQHYKTQHVGASSSYLHLHDNNSWMPYQSSKD